MQLPARKFHDADDSPTVMSVDKKEQIILNSGEELFAEIRYVVLFLIHFHAFSLYEKAHLKGILLLMKGIKTSMGLDLY